MNARNTRASALKTVLIVIGMLAASTATQAESAPTALGLRQLLAAAQLGNKNLQAARYAVSIGQARLLSAGMRDNPRLDISGRSDFLFGNEGEHGSAVAISQSFPIAGRLMRQKDVARVDIALAEIEVAEAERRLAEQVVATVYQLLVRQQRIGLLTELITMDEKLAKTTRARFNAAEISELDVNTVQLDLQQRLLEREQLHIEQDATTVTLNTLLGRPAATPLAVIESLPDKEVLLNLSTLQANALKQRPDFQGALLAIDRASAENALAHSLRWQDWSVALELSQDKPVIYGAPPQDNSRAIGVSVSIPLPLFNKSQGLIAEANGNHDQAIARVEAMRLSILSEVAGAHAEATRLQALMMQFTDNTRTVSERSLRLAQHGYEQGLIPIFDFVQTQRQQTELNEAYLSTLEQFLQALVRLHAATGDYAPTSFAANSQL